MHTQRSTKISTQYSGNVGGCNRQRRQVRRFVSQSDSDEYRDGEDDDYEDD